MANIKLLDESIINKIAAGEVVENPKSIVKEMVENSLDAGATKITVEIKDGGKKLIRISDNGKGIPKDDLEIAFMRHATSKISKESDLEEIYTLGFRGEALSSISAVSKVELVTRTDDSISGRVLKINGGTIEENAEIGCNVGTTFTVSDLFHNVPARQKFLKKTTTESGYIYDLMNNLALSKPNVSFKLISNDSVLLHTSGNGNLKHVLFQIYGKKILDNLTTLNFKDDIIEISGYIADPIKNNRSTKKYGTFILNGRCIKSDLMYDSVKSALGDNLMTGKYPVFCININIIPSYVDVNVHPNKLEVRFSDEKLIYDVIYSAIKNSFSNNFILNKNDNLNDNKIELKDLGNKAINYNNENFIKESSAQVKENNTQINNIHYSDLKTNSNRLSVNEPKPNNKTNEPKPIFKVLDEVYNKEIILKNSEPTKVDEPIFKKDIVIENIHVKPTIEFKFIGQLFNTYCIIEKDNSIFLIDQHAAHEKVTYEKILKQLRNNEVNTQILLQPLSIVLNDIETIFLQENLALFSNFGFNIEEFGKNTFVIRGVPIIFSNPVGVDFFNEILDLLIHEKKRINNIYDLKLDKVASIACKSSVKANKYLSEIEVKDLVNNMLLLENPNTCPHGRPTMIEVTKKEIEKLFKRII